MHISFNVVKTSNQSTKNVKLLVDNPELLLKKHFSKKCEEYFEQKFIGYKAIMTSSCTKALEIIALSLNISEGDEVIMPSYNFVGVANAFANFGAKLVFVDINPKTMVINHNQIEEAITNKTRAILVMHYNGVSCNIEKVLELSSKYKIPVIEDNAQGITSTYKDQLLGSFGDFSCISFDSLKNISCSEGGVLLVKEKYYESVLTVYNNGTDRLAYEQGKVEHFQWIGKGSKYSLSEYNSAVLYPLLIDSESINDKRNKIWKLYLEKLIEIGVPIEILPIEVSKHSHNGHIFFIKCKDKLERKALIIHLNENGVEAHPHYPSLHNSNNAIKNNFKIIRDTYTTTESEKLLRLPIYSSIKEEQIEYITTILKSFFN